MAKHIFVTGGVVSSLGKGLTSASIGYLLKNRGLRVAINSIILLPSRRCPCPVPFYSRGH